MVTMRSPLIPGGLLHRKLFEVIIIADEGHWSPADASRTAEREALSREIILSMLLAGFVCAGRSTFARRCAPSTQICSALAKYMQFEEYIGV